MDIKELLAYCDHTLLRVDCTEAEIRKLCDQAIKYGCASVCIPPCHVPGAKRYVINLSMVKDGCWEDVAEYIKAVRRSCLGKVLKVIIECCLLTDEEKMRMCTIVSECGADFIKTSTGFSKGGATRHDVELLRRCSPDSLQVKAAGGIASLEDAEDFIALGATRLGTSRIVKLAMELERASAGTDTGSENY